MTNQTLTLALTLDTQQPLTPAGVTIANAIARSTETGQPVTLAWTPEREQALRRTAEHWDWDDQRGELHAHATDNAAWTVVLVDSTFEGRTWWRMMRGEKSS
jgi:hypothetical protein